MKLNQLYAGGSFGRRANPKSDFVLEAAAIAKTIRSGGKRQSSSSGVREDDMRAALPADVLPHAAGGLDSQGNLIAWKHVIVGQSILAGTAFESMMVKDGVGHVGRRRCHAAYAIPNLAVSLHSPKMGVPVQWWRSVGSTHTAFATECFLDEIARETKKDPFELRRALLGKHPRHKAVLEAAAARAGWGKPLPQAARAASRCTSPSTPMSPRLSISAKIERVFARSIAASRSIRTSSPCRWSRESATDSRRR